METEIKLCDFLLKGLSSSQPSIPGRRTFHLHVLVGAERRTGSLFPYATGRKVRVGVRDVVVLLSEEKEEGKEVDEKARRVITCGIEAALYRIPQTSSGILYISKVDSTGHGARPSVTGVLVRRFISFFTGEEVRKGWMMKHLWVHVFARSQGEYLFLGSKEWKGKRVLGDVGLCGWWKRCLGDVGEGKVRRWYLMPGLSEREALESLGEKGKDRWEYGHPYGQKEVGLPCGGEERYLGRIIPHFEDDPKSRFLDELANDEGGILRSPKRKRPRLEKDEESRVVGEIGKVGVDEFWERMGFRQECVAGAVTGFYTLLVWSDGESWSGDVIGKPRKGEVSGRIVGRVVGLLKSGGIDFSTEEKACRATEVLESTIKGLCEGIYYYQERSHREKTPERRTHLQLADMTPNPFPEPVASLDTYYEHIYHSTTIDNPIISTTVSLAQSNQVTKLVPRRKLK